MATTIRMPEILTGSTEAVLVRWLIELGDDVKVGQPLAEVETEKAVVDYEAEQSGMLAGYLVELGESVAVGTPIALLADAGESSAGALAAAGTAPTLPPANGRGEAVGSAHATAPDQAPGTEAATTAQPSGIPEPATSIAALPNNGRRFASPLVRKLVRERNLDISAIRGSGPDGRIVRRDIDEMDAPRVATKPPETAAVSVPPTARPEEAADHTDVPHTGMRRAIARRLTESKSSIPHFYLVADCLVDALIDLRRTVNEQLTVKVSLNDFVVKAVAAAFKDVPEANAIWTDDAVRRFDKVDIAIAVAVDGGLVTPVVRGVDKRSLSDVAATISDLASRGRAGRLKQHELEGGSFDISNLGMFGVKEFAAIINPPQSGILAVGAATPRPVVIAGELTVASVMTVTLSGDHRVLDGALAARWLGAFTRRIENPLSIIV